jgi:predicted nucleic acid-binding protein
MRYLVDTCVISELIKKSPADSVVSWIREQDELSLYLSVLTFGELEKGLSKLGDSRRKLKLRNWVDCDLKHRFSGRILAFDYETACRWGEISGSAERIGRPMPVIDGQLAATALIHGMTFVTRNSSDVECCGVMLLNPWEDL